MVCESVRASNEQQVLTGSKQRRAKPKAAVLRLLQWGGVVYMLGPTRTREDGHAFSCAARRGGGYECYCY